MPVPSSFAARRGHTLALLAQARSAETLEQVRIAALGRKGWLTAALRDISQLPPPERRAAGQKLNQIKASIQHALASAQRRVKTAGETFAVKPSAADASLPVETSPLLAGRIHPLSQVLDETLAIFASLGFQTAAGPEIESEDYNFTALNIPAGHPAREMHDTFYLTAASADGEPLLLRTHTSPVQIRAMETLTPPVRLIAPGRVYRCDSDRTHTPMFHQIEALVIEEDIHMGHLLGLMKTFLARCFGESEIMLRVRPSYFPFTEPSVEIDVAFTPDGHRAAIEGEGIGEDEIRWLEIAGAGMVHRNVLRRMRLDYDRHQGFAFGLGLDRLAALKYGLPDLRAFFAGDLGWIQSAGLSPFASPAPAIFDAG